MGACQSNYNSNFINILYLIPILSLLLTIQTNNLIKINNNYLDILKNCILFMFYLFLLQYILLRLLIISCKTVKEKEMIIRHLKFFISFPVVIFSFLFASYFVVFVLLGFLLSIKIKIDSVTFSYVSGFIISYIVYLLLIDFMIKCTKNEFCES